MAKKDKLNNVNEVGRTSTPDGSVFGAIIEMLDTSPIGIAVFSREKLSLVYCNDFIRRFFSSHHNPSSEITIWDLFPALKTLNFEIIIESVFSSGKPFTSDKMQFMVSRRDEVTELAYVKITLHCKADSNMRNSLMMTLTEVTDAAGADKIERGANEVRDIINTIPATVWITDRNGYCTFLNQRWYDYTGMTKEEALGFGWLNATHPEDKEESGKTFIQANEKQTSFSLLYRLKTRDGEYRWCLDTGIPIYDRQGNFDGYIGSVIDVHEEKTNHEKIRVAEEELQRTHEKLRIATESAMVGTWSLDHQTENLEWSALHKKLWGYDESQQDLTYEDWHRVILPGDKEKAFAKVEKARVNRTQYEAIYRIKRVNDGVTRWMRSVGKYFYDENGTPTIATGISIDVTDQKTAEERFQTLAETLPQLVWMTNGEGRNEYTSRQWIEYSGVDPNTPGAWEIVIHPDDAPRVMDIWKLSLRSGRSFAVEARLRSKDGLYRWHVAKAEPVRNSDDRIILWIGAYTDIDDQKTITEKLQGLVEERTAELKTLNETLIKRNVELENTQAFLQQLIDSSVEFVCVLDKNLNIIAVNKRFEETRNTSRDLLIGKNIFETTPQATGTIQHQSILKALHGETIYLPKQRSIGIHGYYLDSYFVPLRIQNEVEGVIIMSRDVTEIVRSEELLAQKNVALERSNLDLQQFAHVASHDLKEPLRKIQMFLDRVEQDTHTVLSTQSKRYVEKITKAASRMSSMIDGVLNYSSVDALGKSDHVVDLNGVFGSILQDLELVIENKHAAITVSPLPETKGSSMLLYQVFYNLVNNALKFSKRDVPPMIDISGSEDERTIVITITDNGIGFNQKHAEEIFNTFTRLNSKDLYEGTGLGLSLCKKILERHDGRIWAKSEPGVGSQFFVSLPK